MWKMKPPEKKALVKREDPNELRSKIRKGARKKNMEPVKALSEFQEIDSFCWGTANQFTTLLLVFLLIKSIPAKEPTYAVINYRTLCKAELNRTQRPQVLIVLDQMELQGLIHVKDKNPVPYIKVCEFLLIHEGCEQMLWCDIRCYFKGRK